MGNGEVAVDLSEIEKEEYEAVDSVDLDEDTELLLDDDEAEED